MFPEICNIATNIIAVLKSKRFQIEKTIVIKEV